MILSKYYNILIIYLLICLILIHPTYQQQKHPSTLPQTSTPKSTNPDHTIHFIMDTPTNPRHIPFKQISFSFITQIPDDYNIVHTHHDLYQLNSKDKIKFVSSTPKDNFVNKLISPTNKNTKAPNSLPKASDNPNLNHPNPPQQSTKDTKQLQNKAQQILQKQTLQQQAKLKQQKLPPPQSSKDNTSPPNHQQQKNDLFSKIKPQKTPQIAKPDTKIKFKQHVIAKPSTITTYPFEIKNAPQQIKNPTQKQAPKPTEQTKNEQKEKQVKKGGQKSQEQKAKQPQSEKPKQKAQKVQKAQKEQKKPIVVDNNKSKDEKDGKAKNGLSGKQESIQKELDPQMLQQYKKLEQFLKQKPQKIQKSLQFESEVKSLVNEQQWKYMIVKIIIVVVIVLSILQASCSSSGQQLKIIEKGKYQPVGLSEVQIQNSFEIVERGDNK